MIVLLRNRIELVIVALRAPDGEPEEPARGGIDLIIDHLPLGIFDARFVESLRADGQKTRGRQIFIPCLLRCV